MAKHLAQIALKSSSSNSAAAIARSSPILRPAGFIWSARSVALACRRVRWPRRFPQAVSQCDARQWAVPLHSGARKAPVQQKLARRAVLAHRSPAALVEKAASRSRDRRAVVRPLQRASGSLGRPQRPLHARPASGPHPSAEASRASPRRALFEATCAPTESPSFATTCLRYEMRLGRGDDPVSGPCRRKTAANTAARVGTTLFQ
jgi:hypothetical protein